MAPKAEKKLAATEEKEAEIASAGKKPKAGKKLPKKAGADKKKTLLEATGWEIIDREFRPQRFTFSRFLNGLY
ncbi:hypothetical protein KY290_018674 [Solanum tuberosum]|uniref:Uncharacterized protein n=1 Tax=Solanum tuberosum TaxID=4113 RepID=A0ABQ7VF70_SOLTU|nr:hypothetical protein KY290_018674 [Solanum tuberosum]